MALTPEQITDFVNTTTHNFKRRKWTDISLPYVEYISQNLINDKKVNEVGGDQIQFTVQVKNTGNAQVSGLYQQDNTRVEDVTVTGLVPWTYQRTAYAYDVMEDLFQTDRETIVRMLLIREHEALNSMAELAETQLWSEPASSTDKVPMGIPFWVRKDATTTVAGGFEGGNPTATGLTGGCAGISSATYPKWDNWAFGYTSVTTDDAIKKIKKSVVFTRFRAPVPHPSLGYGNAQYQIFTTYGVTEPMERLAETRNDNLGKDLARYMNQVTVAGIPVTMVHYLDTNDSTDPIYGIDFGSFRPFVKKNWNMKKWPPQQVSGQHTVYRVFWDNAMNYCCFDRRRNWVGSTS